MRPQRTIVTGWKGGAFRGEADPKKCSIKTKIKLTGVRPSVIFASHTVTINNKKKMRTKALLLSAIALASSLVVASAQVYSQNVVGYYQLTLTNGYQLVANQLDLDGTGTNNTLQTVLGTNGLPNLTRVYAFDPASGTYATATFLSASASWSGGTAAVNAALSLGRGVFVQIPAAASPVTVTVVGQVPQGTLNTPVPNNNTYAIVSSQVPQAGLVQTELGYAPANLDRVYRYNSAAQNYGAASTYLSGSGTWSGGGQPNVTVGESFWLQGHAGSLWTRNFTVQ